MSTSSTAKLAAAGAALAAIVSLAGCGGSSPGASAASFPNPVDIIKKINACVLPSGVTQGDVGLDGTFKTASCTSAEQTIITVDTFKDADAKAADLAAHPSGDGQAAIVGDNFIVYLTAPIDINNTGIDFNPVPENVQYAVGGKVIQ